ncbi:MAG: 3-carboxy-cis,cis-muconate cycloisomerase [Actinomycetota bacterium]|nr:3-carboxy-cis,cis-muconate cycloisomerase [Actinomycetota bacterium]
MTSPLWDPIFGKSAVSATTNDAAWVQAMCDAEAALARACARTGLVSEDAARAVSRSCADAALTDPAELGADAAADGNPVIPLVKQLRSHIPEHAEAVHFGATSQDILDTSTMLVSRQALAVILSALDDVAAACVRLAAAHRNTPMIGRTLMQQALPTTFGALAAGWGEGVDRTTARLAALRDGCAVQLGGAAGTLAGWHPHGPAVRAALAEELGLQDPGTVWHSERSRITELASALGAACGAINKIGTDVVLLAQTEVGEVREGAGGGSSTMAHKHNPIAAITARAAAGQAPALVATLHAAMSAELQRGAGPWHSEWQPLIGLLNTTGGAATRLATSLTGLHVDAEAMARNLGANTAPDLGHAGDLVDCYLQGRQS